MGLAVNHSADSSSYYTFAIRGVSGELVLTSLSLLLYSSFPPSLLSSPLFSFFVFIFLYLCFLFLFFFLHTHMLIPKYKGLIKVTSLLQGMTFSAHLLPFSYMCIYRHRVWIQLGLLWKKRRQRKFSSKGIIFVSSVLSFFRKAL